MLIKSSAIYLVSSVINKGLPFLLLPILTKYLTPEEYGMVAIFQLSITVFYAFIGMGSSINIDKNFHRYNKKEASNMLTNIILLVTASLLTICILTFIFLSQLSSLLNIDQNWSEVCDLGETSGFTTVNIIQSILGTSNRIKHSNEMNSGLEGESLQYIANLNFEEKAFIDFMIGKNAQEVYGHNKSSFSLLLNFIKNTNNYYNNL